MLIAHAVVLHSHSDGKLGLCQPQVDDCTVTGMKARASPTIAGFVKLLHKHQPYVLSRLTARPSIAIRPANAHLNNLWCLG